MIRPDAGSYTSLQVLGLGNPLLCDVSRVEGRRDDDVCIDNFLVKGRVCSFLVICDDIGVALTLEPFSDPLHVRHGNSDGICSRATYRAGSPRFREAWAVP